MPKDMWGGGLQRTLTVIGIGWSLAVAVTYSTFIQISMW